MRGAVGWEEGRMPPLSVDEMRRRRMVRQEKDNREAGLVRGHKTKFDLAREKGFVEEVSSPHFFPSLG